MAELISQFIPEPLESCFGAFRRSELLKPSQGINGKERKSSNNAKTQPQNTDTDSHGTSETTHDNVKTTTEKKVKVQPQMVTWIRTPTIAHTSTGWVYRIEWRWASH